MTTTRHVLVVRLDSLGDVLVSGPAVRAVGASASRVSLLAGPQGGAVARLLPGVDDVLVWSCPWIAADAPPVDRADVRDVVSRLAALDADEALVLTSFHQSALPTALLLRLAGVRRVAAVSEDYPGSLLDVRIPDPPDGPEPERMLAVARAAGYDLPRGDDGRLAVALPDGPNPRQAVAELAAVSRPYVVVHPGVTAPARAYPPQRFREVVGGLTARGFDVVVTGSADEAALTAYVAGGRRERSGVHDLGGRLDLPALAEVLAGAAAVAVANTGPAHLAAAVGTPVVSLFAPVVPASRWAPYGVPFRLLGDQAAPCRDTRARLCPVAGHPCLGTVEPSEVVDAVCELAADPREPVLAASSPLRGGA